MEYGFRILDSGIAERRLWCEPPQWWRINARLRHTFQLPDPEPRAYVVEGRSRHLLGPFVQNVFQRV